MIITIITVNFCSITFIITNITIITSLLLEYNFLTNLPGKGKEIMPIGNLEFVIRDF